MGMGTNVLVILVVVSIFFFLAGARSGAMIIAEFLTGDWETGEVKYSGWWNTQILVSLTAASGAAIIATAFGRSVSGILTAALVTTLATFAGFPISVMVQEGMPWELKLLIGGVFTTLYLLALISFTRGYDF